MRGTAQAVAAVVVVGWSRLGRTEKDEERGEGEGTDGVS